MVSGRRAHLLIYVDGHSKFPHLWSAPLEVDRVRPGFGLDPVSWTFSERRIRCPRWQAQARYGGRGDVSRRVSSHRFRSGCASPTRDVVFKEYSDLACGACVRRFVPSKAVWETRLDAGAFSREHLVRHLALELDAEVAVSGHGFTSKYPPALSILPPQTVHFRGALQQICSFRLPLTRW